MKETVRRCLPRGGLEAGRRARVDRSAVSAAPGRVTRSSRSSRISRYFLRSYSGGFDASPARLQEVEDRLAVLERLKKKHGPTLQDVIDAWRCADARARVARALRTSGLQNWTANSRRRGRPISAWPRRCPRNAGLPRRRSVPGSSPRWPTSR